MAEAAFPLRPRSLGTSNRIITIHFIKGYSCPGLVLLAASVLAFSCHHGVAAFRLRDRPVVRPPAPIVYQGAGAVGGRPADADAAVGGALLSRQPHYRLSGVAGSQPPTWSPPPKSSLSFSLLSLGSAFIFVIAAESKSESDVDGVV